MMDMPRGIGDQLAMCCGLNRRQRGYGFESAAGPSLRRNQEPNYYYSPSMMQIHPGNTWPMIGPPVAPAQPYVLLTQPVIIASNASPAAQPNSMAFIQHHAQASLLPATPNTSPFHQQQQQQAISMLIGPQTGVQRQSLTGIDELAQQQRPRHQLQANSQLAIYGHSSRPVINRMTNRSQQQLALGQFVAQQTPTRQQLTAETFKRLELIEKQVDLGADMELIKRHGIVITRAIDPYTLAPYLTDETLRKYRNYLFDNDHVIRFIEVIKRPGQTLGIYIRTVQFENPQLHAVHEGLVITKIESDSPIYNSQVLHVGDEILAVNLIDIQGMNLDDVVVLMSIPRRLVLTLRISKERDQDIRESFLNQLQKQEQQQQQQLSSMMALKNSMTQNELTTANLLFNRNSLRSPTTNLALVQAQLGGRGRAEGMSMRPTTDGSESRDNLDRLFQRDRGAMVNDLGMPQSSPSAMTELYHARPVRVQSALGTEIAGDIGGSPMQFAVNANQTNDDLLNRYTTTGAAQNGASNPGFSRLNSFDRPTWLNERIGKLHEQKFSPQVERQEAMSAGRGSENGCRLDEDGGLLNETSSRFENVSIDKELASLEREAMGRDRSELAMNDRGNGGPSGADEMSRQSERSRLENRFSPVDDQPQSYQPRRPIVPSTLPRRALPSRPDMPAPSSPPSPPPRPPLGSTISAESAIKQPVISNIRLGNTPEQSSYFSSSIEAINRELKELRRQRISFS